MQYAPLAADDLVKIDLGVHIDGFIAVVAHTAVVPPSAPSPLPEAAGQTDKAAASAPVPPLTGPRAAAINAAWVAAELAVKLVRAGGTNTAVTAAVKRVAEAFDVRPVSGTLMHQMKQFVVDGSKMIQLRDDSSSGEQKVRSLN